MIVYELIIYTPDGDWVTWHETYESEGNPSRPAPGGTGNPDRSNIMTSKTKAIAIARDAAGTIYGHGTSWCFNHPFYDDQLDGPSTTTQASSYAAIREMRTNYVADLALSLMGYEDAYTFEMTGRVEDRVNEWLRKYAKDVGVGIRKDMK